MMMQILRAGGLDLVYSEEREAKLRRQYNGGDRPGNPNGFYEPKIRDMQTIAYSDRIPDGHVVTIFTEYLPLLGTKPTTVIWMDRDPEEIRLSQLSMLAINLAERYPDWPKTYQAIRDKVRRILDDRGSVTCLEVQHGDCISQPLSVTQSLVKAGIPINAWEAAKAVEPELYRWASTT